MAIVDAEQSSHVQGRTSADVSRVMRRLGSTLLLAAAAVFAEPSLISTAQAQDQVMPSAPSGTNLHGNDGNETLSTLLSFGCSYVFEGDPLRLNTQRLTCRFATTRIARPTPEQVAERLRDLDVAEPQKERPADFQEVCKALGTTKAQADMRSAAGRARVYFDRITKACAEQDPNAGKEALRYNITEIWARTCEAFNYGAREYEFQKVDDSTFRSMAGAAAGGTATIRTIWRKKGASDFVPWSYKQVTSADPSCVPVPFRECAKDATEEWTSDASMTLTGCEFFN
jgi:hypothetical protein